MLIRLVFLFGTALVMQAQDGGGRGLHGGRFRGPNVGFITLDTNSDGVLDAGEIDAAPKSLAKLDKDGDGQITSDEVRQALPRRGGPGGPGGRDEHEHEGSGNQTNMADEMVKTLMAFDANGDGKLIKAELPDRYQGLFDRGDANKDGFLTPDEIRKMLAAQAPPPDTGRQGGGRGEGRRGDMNFIHMDPVLAALDTNGDGVISADELRNAAASLKKLDKDGDGKITSEEAAPAPREDREHQDR